MLMADTVMDADEPRFQIGEDEMDDRQIVLDERKVFIPALAELAYPLQSSVTVTSSEQPPPRTHKASELQATAFRQQFTIRER